MNGYISTASGWRKSDAKPIPDWPGYMVAPDGRVYGKHGQLIGHHRTGFVHLRKDGKTYRCLIAKLILETFVGPCPDGYCLEYLKSRKLFALPHIKWSKFI